jgi:hypothetical protein
LSKHRNLAPARRAGARESAEQPSGELAELFFAHTTVDRVEAHTDVDNIACAAGARAGRVHEGGLIRGAQWQAGASRDGYLYAMLRRDLATNGTANRT